MAQQKGERGLAAFLRCASMLEEKTFTFYNGLSKIVKHLLFRHLLLYAAHDSFEHLVFLRKIGEEIVTRETKKSNCEKSMIFLWKAATKMGEEILEKQFLNDRSHA